MVRVKVEVNWEGRRGGEAPISRHGLRSCRLCPCLLTLAGLKVNATVADCHLHLVSWEMGAPEASTISGALTEALGSWPVSVALDPAHPLCACARSELPLK